MAIKEEQEIPRDLPAARLFLDDVEEIVKILSNAMEYQDKAGQVIRPSTVFRVGRFSCDSIEDLPKLGRRSNNFQIKLDIKDYLGYGSLELSRYGTRWDVHPVNDEWSVYGRLHEVFQKRQYLLKNYLLKMGGWFFVICSFIALILFRVLLPSSFHRPVASASLVEWSVGVGILVAMMVLLYQVFFEHSVVEFRYSYDQVPG